MVSVGVGDFVQIEVNPRGQALIVKTYDSAGNLFRGAELGPKEDNLNLVPELPGAYRVEVAFVQARFPSSEHAVTMQLDEIRKRLCEVDLPEGFACGVILDVGVPVSGGMIASIAAEDVALVSVYLGGRLLQDRV